MDPRKKWMEGKKRKIKRRRPPQTTPLPERFWANEAPTIANDVDDFRIEPLLRRIRAIRQRNEIFADELNDMLDIDRVQGTHNRNNRARRGEQIVHQVRQNNELLNELNNELNELNEEYDDITSNLRN